MASMCSRRPRAATSSAEVLMKDAVRPGDEVLELIIQLLAAKGDRLPISREPAGSRERIRHAHARAACTQEHIWVHPVLTKRCAGQPMHKHKMQKELRRTSWAARAGRGPAG